MYSKILAEYDQNTMIYMIDVMKAEIEQKDAEIEQSHAEIEKSHAEIERLKKLLEEKG